MKKVLIPVVLLIILLPTVLYFQYPEFLFHLSLQAARFSAGLSAKEIQAGNDRIVYLDGGRGETIMLLHGFGANKDHWVEFAERLTGVYHVIIPDLPGFGESTKRADENYGFDAQVKRLDRFAEVLGLEKFHLAGNSMGGMIAAVYGARFPQKAPTLALLAPYGLRTAKKTDFLLEASKEGTNPFRISNTDDLDKVLRYIFFKPPTIPDAFKKVIIAQSIASTEFNVKIMKDMIDEGLALESFLPMIQAPVCIIWGDQDKILDISGASVLKDNLKNSRTIIMKETGHTPMAEKPGETAEAYIRFLKN